MTDREEIFDQLDDPTVDKLLAVLSTVSSAAPWPGGLISNIVGGISSEHKRQRIIKVMKSLFDYFEEFRKKVPEEYVKSEDFKDLFKKTLRKVQNEENEDKRKMYENFLKGALTSPEEPYNEKIRFFNTLEQVQYVHIEIIRALMKPPTAKFVAPGGWGTRMHTLQARLPADFTEDLIQDLVDQLNDLRITDIKELNQEDFNPDVLNLQDSVTEYGKRFFRFIGGDK